MSEQTPGPWADDEALNGGIHSTVTGKMLIPHSVPLSPEDRTLILAAPDLLETLRGLVTLCQEDESYHDPENEPDSYAALERAEAAIA